MGLNDVAYLGRVSDDVPRLKEPDFIFFVKKNLNRGLEVVSCAVDEEDRPICSVKEIYELNIIIANDNILNAKRHFFLEAYLI